jgi:hypothetical protein
MRFVGFEAEGSDEVSCYLIRTLGRGNPLLGEPKTPVSIGVPGPQKISTNFEVANLPIVIARREKNTAWNWGPLNQQLVAVLTRVKARWAAGLACRWSWLESWLATVALLGGRARPLHLRLACRTQEEGIKDKGELASEPVQLTTQTDVRVGKQWTQQLVLRSGTEVECTRVAAPDESGKGITKPKLRLKGIHENLNTLARRTGMSLVFRPVEHAVLQLRFTRCSRSCALALAGMVAAVVMVVGFLGLAAPRAPSALLPAVLPESVNQKVPFGALVLTPPREAVAKPSAFVSKRIPSTMPVKVQELRQTERTRSRRRYHSGEDRVLENEVVVRHFWTQRPQQAEYLAAAPEKNSPAVSPNFQRSGGDARSLEDGIRRNQKTTRWQKIKSFFAAVKHQDRKSTSR